MYANDVVLIGKSKQSRGKDGGVVYGSGKAENANKQKMEYMEMTGRNRGTKSLILNGQSLNSMRDFRYLGSMIVADRNEEMEVTWRNTSRMEKSVIRQESYVTGECQWN